MNSIATDKIRDRECISKEDDWLGYYSISKFFFDYIREKTPPISVGIFGKWGSGKSVFINFLSEHAKKIFCVTKYDAIDSVNNPENKISSKITKEIKRQFFIESDLRKVCILLSLIVVFIIYIFFDLKKIFSILLYFVILVSPFLLSHFSKFINLSSRIFNKLTGRFFKNKEFIIIIDNIDRIPPKEAIKFLEILKFNFLSKKSIFSKCIFVIPCDIDVLEGEINDIYKDKNISPRDHLSKLVEFAFYLPSYEGNYREGLIKSLLKESIHPEIRKNIAHVFSSKLFNTPREIKIFLQELDMIFVISKARGKEEDYLLSNLDKLLVLQALKIKFSNFFFFLKQKYIEKSTGTILKVDCKFELNKFITKNSERTRKQVWDNGLDGERETFLFDEFWKLFTIVMIAPPNLNLLDLDIMIELFDIIDSASQKHTLEFSDSVKLT